ncbi:hypothetical protein [Niallia circulans]|uniref:hypothetical protein n=1 Tax=Niallia circulans TaxID=1397 RepID=UPI00352C727A
MRKKFIITLIVSLSITILFIIFYNNSLKENKLDSKEAEQYSVTPSQNNEDEIKKLGKNIKVPKKVFINGENLANRAHSANYSELSNSLSEFRQMYSSDNFDITIVLNIIRDNENQEISIGSMEETTITKIKLTNGIDAEFSNDNTLQILSFTDPNTKLFYSLVGEKKKGQFSIEELTEIANSIY